LPCTFVLSEDDEGPLDIEWVLIPADNQKKEQIVSTDFFWTVLIQLIKLTSELCYCLFKLPPFQIGMLVVLNYFEAPVI